MAIDTDEKRCSTTHLLVPSMVPAQFPDGVMTQADRQDSAWVYRGILAGPAVPPAPGAGASIWFFIKGGLR